MGDASLPVSQDDVVELWKHSHPTSTRMWEFLQIINDRYRLNLKTYDDLYQWSIDNIPEFWEETWHFTGIKASKPFDKVNEFSYVARDWI